MDYNSTYSLCNGAFLFAPYSFLLNWVPMALAYLLVAISVPKKYQIQCSTPLGPGGKPHALSWEGVGGPNSDEGTDTLVLYLYYNHSTVMLHLSSFLGPKWHLLHSLPFQGPKSLHFQCPTLPLALEMVLPASKSLRPAQY
jgi:hypothetical protein